MIRALLLLLLKASAGSCPTPDGSPTAPFYVDQASTEALASGSSCAPFTSLESALVAASSLTEVTISLQSQTSLLSRSLEDEVVLLGNLNQLDLTGTILVLGSLKIIQAKLTSSVSVDFILEVTGTLFLDTCNVTSFSSLPVHVRGKVDISNSLFSDNARGVFASFMLGGNLTVTGSQFFRNARNSGAVFFLSPASGQDATNYLISNCEFKGNGAKGRNSVLVLNEYSVLPSVEKQTITFLRSNFSGHPAPTFQLINRLFSLIIREGKFENETQLVTGTLIETNVTVAGISVSNSKGPLFVLQFPGIFNLTSSNFTNIGNGPLVHATGKGMSSSLIFLSRVRVAYISNSDKDVRSILILARYATVRLEYVHLENFTSTNVGVFDLFQSVLISQNFSSKNGTANQSVVGTSLFSSFNMWDTSIEALGTGGAMWVIFQSTANITRIKYRNIAGPYVAIIKSFITNLFTIRSRSEAVITGLDIQTVVTGTSLIYVYNSSLSFSSSVIAGPGGVPTLACNGGIFIIRDVVINITTSQSIIRNLAGGLIDIDRMILRDMTLTSAICTLSSDSIVRIQTLVISNTTCVAVTSGQHFNVEIDEALIENSNIGTLVDSGIVV